MWDFFTSKKSKSGNKPVTHQELNTALGQLAIGNQILRIKPGQGGRDFGSYLYPSLAGVTDSGKVVSIDTLSRNSTVMSCVAAKAKALAQCPIFVANRREDGSYGYATQERDKNSRDYIRARQVEELFRNPNEFQSGYEFIYQLSQWIDLLGDAYVYLPRANNMDINSAIGGMYVMDSSLVTSTITENLYPLYRIASSTTSFSNAMPQGDLPYYSIVHVQDMSWQGQGSWTKGTLCVNLIAIDDGLDQYANWVLSTGGKVSAVVSTDGSIPEGRLSEMKARLKNSFANLVGRQADKSSPGETLILEYGLKYQVVDMLSLQDADAANLKAQVMKRIAALFGVPHVMITGEGSYNNTSRLVSEFYKNTISPLVKNLEQHFTKQLLRGYPNLKVCFDTTEYLRGDLTEQTNVSKVNVSSGVWSQNDARRFMGMPAVDDEEANKLVRADLKGAMGQDQPNARGDDVPVDGSSDTDTNGSGNIIGINRTGRAGAA